MNSNSNGNQKLRQIVSGYFYSVSKLNNQIMEKDLGNKYDSDEEEVLLEVDSDEENLKKGKNDRNPLLKKGNKTSLNNGKSNGQLLGMKNKMGE